MFMGGKMTLSSGYSRLLIALGAAIAVLAVLVPIASATEPKEGYKQFAGCPDSVEAPTISTCFRAEITGGHFKMGNKDVPITNPITLSGGFSTNGQEFKTTSKGGLSKSPQKVPGGLVGITGLEFLEELLAPPLLELYAVTELAGNPGPPLADPLSLPLKVHLENPVLGPSCYVGSDKEPIALNLTWGTTNPPKPNEPITGTEPTFSAGGAPGITKASGAVYVDNSFAAPGANGCKLTLFGFIPVSLDGVVDLASGLPAKAGTNETKQNTDAEVVLRKRVY
jgi:hypothetical protein